MAKSTEIRALESRLTHLESEFAKLSEQLQRLTRHVMGEMHELEESVAQFRYGTDQPGQ